MTYGFNEIVINTKRHDILSRRNAVQTFSEARVVNPLRTITATAGGIITGLINLLSTRDSRGHRVELKPGDIAPDFTLIGSDGRSYSLSDFRGTDAVVLAWFPKAFTPG